LEEYPVPTYTGTEGNDVLVAQEYGDVLDGRGGDDVLDSRRTGGVTAYGGDGNDTFISGESPFLSGGGARFYGGAGNDTYFVSHYNVRFDRPSSDYVFENAGEGYDRVATSVSYQLPSNVEVLEAVNLTDTYFLYLHGNDEANLIIGNAGHNELVGRGGDDVLIGGGGADTMWGDLGGIAGNDTFYVDNAGDVVFENSGEGIDRVYSSVSYELRPDASIEELGTDNWTATNALNLTGSNAAQTITGNMGSNVLRGLDGDDVLRGLDGDDLLAGDAGADLLIGGLGNDTYYADADDTIQEDGGQGNDRVAAMTSVFLSAAASIEVLEAVNRTGTDLIDLGGSDTVNFIGGNDGTNILYGRGGSDTLYGYDGDDFLVGGEAGKTDSDTMVGGAGNDTYYVFSSTDIIREVAGEGFDRVATKVSFTLDRRAAVERLEAGDSTSTDPLTLIGSDFGNTIVGNAGNNLIDGARGNDTLIGGAGADIFQFTQSLGADNVDRIEDFEVGVDKIALDDNIFRGFNPGSLDPAYFRTGTQAQDSDDRIIYNPETGALMFDADGSGSGAAVQFATLQPNLGLSASDFMVI
jgi:Ca2+-binding RTX toxin-like protein